MDEIISDILIIGGGAAGMSAALSAAKNSNFSVSVVDDNPTLGGQIWRAEMGKVTSPDAKKLVEKIDSNEISVLNGTQVFAKDDGNSLLAETQEGAVKIKYKRLILATGARERFLPFPGWTLPNVFGAGGLQALVKSGLSVQNKKIVVSGTGALLIAVAEYLKSKGAKVLVVAEQTSQKKLTKFGFGLWREPGKLIQAANLKLKLIGVKYQTDSFVTSAEGESELEAVNLNRKGRSWRIECDMLACGFHLVPNIELASILGCEISNGNVSVNEYQETSVKNVFCAGEPTGIGGLENSLIEGEISGLSAVGNKEMANKLFAIRGKSKRFADAMNEAFELRDELKTLPNAETIVCRCEDVKFGSIKEFSSFREAKLQARCGMGACQGRVCTAATEYLFDWKNESVRPPIFPVKLENLVD